MALPLSSLYKENEMEEQNVINLSHIKSLNVDNANRRSKIQEMFNRDKLSLINIFKNHSMMVFISSR